MAATGGPILSATNPTVNYDDFYVYGYMSDDELMQLAIERSLTETHNNSTTSSAENARSSIPQRRTEIPQPSQHQTLQLTLTPTPCPANPPSLKGVPQVLGILHVKSIKQTKEENEGFYDFIKM
ncbi:ankyrin repeat and SOCS box protein 2 isoform X1 [Tachysurus ichikawai]